MPADRSVVWLVTAEHKVVVNQVLEAMNMGPDNIAQPASADGQDPAGGFYAHSTATGEEAAVYAAMATGTLPAGPYEWPDGAEGALAGLSISVMTGSQLSPNEHLDGMLAGAGWIRIEAV